MMDIKKKWIKNKTLFCTRVYSRQLVLKSREQPTVSNETKLQMKFIAYKEEKSPAFATPRPTNL